MTRQTHPASAVRCAVYTRKPSDEGLEQDFNSLDPAEAARASLVCNTALK